MSHILLRHKTTKEIVSLPESDREGYPPKDWETLARGKSAEVKEFQHWDDDQKKVVDLPEKPKMLRRAELRSLEREELVDKLLEIFDYYEERIQALEAKQGVKPTSKRPKL